MTDKQILEDFDTLTITKQHNPSKTRTVKKTVEEIVEIDETISVKNKIHKLKSDLKKISDSFKSSITTTDNGVVFINTDSNDVESIGVHKVIEHYTVDFQSENWKRMMVESDFQRLCPDQTFQPHRWLIKERKENNKATEHDGNVSGLHVSTILSECGLSVIWPEEFPVGDIDVRVNMGEDENPTMVGSIDLLCIDSQGYLVVADLKTLDLSSIRTKMETLFMKEAHAAQLHLYIYLLEKMAKKIGIDLKVKYGIVIGYANKVIPGRMCIWKIHKNMKKWIHSEGLAPHRKPIIITECQE